MEKTPVLLMLFNRPKYTTLLIRKIKTYSPSKIYIHCDGPREGNQFDIKKSNKIKNIIKKEIDWKCKKKIIFQKKNIGLRKSAISALNFLFSNEMKGIILEDSMLPNKSFFFRYYWEKIFQDAFLKKNKTWDYNLVYSNWLHKSWSIIPKYNLVENQDIYDKINTHKNNFNFKIKKKELKFPLDHPQKFSVNSDYDKIFYKKFYNLKLFFFNIFFARIFKKLLSKIYLKNLFDI